MKLKAGVIGCGKIAQRLHLPQYEGCGKVEIAAVCDWDKNLAQQMADQYGVKNVYTNHNDLLNNKDIDVVSVCIPNYEHCEVVKAAAEAKKHVLCEKPIAMSLKEASEMIEACEKNKVLFMVEQTQRFDPNHEVAKEVLEDGMLGKILSVWARIGHAGPEYWNPDAADWKGGTAWYVTKEQSGGGALIDVGIHIYDLVRWLMGEEVVEISGRTATLVKPFKVEDHGIAHLKFESGAIGGFGVSWNTRPYQVILFFYGEKGTMKVEFGANPPVMVNFGNPTHVGDPNCGWGSCTPNGRDQSRRGGPIAYFMDCIIKGEKPFISGEQGRKSLEGLMGVYKSMETGQVVKFPMKE
ncbi:MAG: Gfo/Idh/MocA family oxidoreductase [bacterium]